MKLHYHCCGKGPDLVLLHGWGLHSEIWSANTHDFAAQLAQHYRLTMIDLPGHGHSNHNDGHFNFNQVVEAISTLLPAASILLGWSLGGLLALQLARQLPQQISHLLLLTSTARFTQGPLWPEAMPADSLRSFALALSVDQKKTVQRFLALQVRGSDNEHQQLQLLKQSLSARPAASIAALNSGLAILNEVDLQSILKKIQQKTLLIYGQRDRIVPAAVGAIMANAMPQARCLTINGAGHAPFLSHPQQTALAILEFLNE